MSLQTILAISESLEINDHRLVGQSLSRNQKLFTSEILTVVPIELTMKPNNYLNYATNRQVLANLRVADKSLEQYLNIGSTGWVHLISYQGVLTPAQITAAQWQPMTAGVKNLILGSLPALTPTSIVFQPGDWVQVDRYAYQVTSQVLRGSAGTVSIPVHRNLLTTVASTQAAVIGQYGQTVAIGGTSYTGITIPVILREYPNYILTPGPANSSFIAWNGPFIALEVVQ